MGVGASQDVVGMIVDVEERDRYDSTADELKRNAQAVKGRAKKGLGVGEELLMTKGGVIIEGDAQR